MNPRQEFYIEAFKIVSDILNQKDEKPEFQEYLECLNRFLWYSDGYDEYRRKNVDNQG